LVSPPSLDIGPQPEFDPTRPEIDDRARHVLVPSLIQIDAVAVGELENLCDALRIDEVVGIDLPSHTIKATSVDR
jgi:hypothetical protein